MQITFKIELLVAATVTLSVMLSYFISYYFFHIPHFGVVLAFTFAGLLAFTQLSDLKLKQALYSTEVLFYILTITNATALLMNLPEFLVIFLIGALAFISFTIGYFRYHISGTVVLLAAFVIIIWPIIKPMELDNTEELLDYIMYQNIGFIIGFLSYLAILLLLPFYRSKPKIPIKYDNYIFVRGLRVSIGIIIALTLTKFLNIYSGAWTCFAILVIAQNSLGSSIKKALERLAGTFLGVFTGTMLAFYIHEAIDSYSFILLIILFIGSFLILKSYAIGLFIFTVLAVGIFFFFSVDQTENINIYSYMISRFFDTLLGIGIFLLLEITILPNTYLKKYHKELIKINFAIYRVIYNLTNQQPNEKIDRKTLNSLNEALDNFDRYTKELKFEPIRLILHRYNLCKLLPDLYKQLYDCLDQLSYIDNKSFTDKQIKILSKTLNIYRLLLKSRKIPEKNYYLTLNYK